MKKRRGFSIALVFLSALIAFVSCAKNNTDDYGFSQNQEEKFSSLKGELIESGLDTEVNESIAFDTRNSYFTFLIAEDSYTLNLQSLYNNLTLTEISWGDGTFNKEISSADSLVHTYNKSGEYCVEITGLCEIGDLAFRAHKYLSEVVIGSSVYSIGNYAFNECSLLTEVAVYAKYHRQ